MGEPDETTSWIGLWVTAAMLAGLACGSALADETVSIGGSRAVLIKPNGRVRA